MLLLRRRGAAQFVGSFAPVPARIPPTPRAVLAPGRAVPPESEAPARP